MLNAANASHWAEIASREENRFAHDECEENRFAQTKQNAECEEIASRKKERGFRT